jgi:glycosyltransferase involved in cell wall biosynthesis
MLSDRTMVRKPKRILFVVGATWVYGAEIAMLSVMRGFKNRGYDVHCVVSGWNDGDFISRLEKESISYSVLYLGFIYITQIRWTLDTLRHYPSTLVKFYGLMRRFQPDYVYHLSHRSVIMLYPFVNKGNSILHVEDVISKCRLNSIFFSVTRRKVTRFIAASNEVKKSLVAVDVPESQISVVLNGVPAPEKIVRHARGTNPNAFRIGIVGQVIRRKGHGVLIDALKIIREQTMDFLCVIIGRGDSQYIGEVKTYIQRYGLEPNILWTDYIKDQNQIYEGLDVLVIPSYDDACPLVALEAALRGVPIIASRVGGLPEIVEHRITGFLFEPGDSKDLAEKIMEIMNDRGLREEIALAAEKHARNNFTDETMCSKIEAALPALA